MKRNFISLGLLVLLVTVPAMAQNPQLVSADAAGFGSGNNGSAAASVSADGRYVVFESQASDLVAGDTNGKWDVFLRDLQTGTTTLVSVNRTGTGGGNGDSGLASVSADGRYVAFVSAATDLVAGVTDTNAARDVFVRDMLPGGTTELVSVSTVAGKTGDKESTWPAISGDGRVVAFLSEATNLTAADGNGLRDVFARDIQADVTTLVSVNRTGTGGGNGVSGPEIGDNSPPDITPDGNYVAFESMAGDLVASDVNSSMDVFVRDLAAQKTTLVSANMANSGAGNNISGGPSMSANGQFIAFVSKATNLASNDTNPSYTFDVFVRDVAAQKTTLVSVNSSGTSGPTGTSYGPSISADGRVVAFMSTVPDLTPAANPYPYFNVYARDLATSKTSIVSAGLGGVWPYFESGGAVISADGRYVAFVSQWPIGANDSGYFRDIYVRDLKALTTTLLSVSNTSGQSGNADSPLQPSISSDGRRVAFVSFANNLVTGDGNAAPDVFAASQAAGSVQFGAASYSVSENGGAATVTVKRTSGAAGAVTVKFATADQTAKAGVEYTATSATLTFNEGEVSKTVTVPIKDDALDEDNKTLLLRLTQPSGGALLGAQNVVQLTVVDNDPTPTLSVANVALTEGNAGTTNFTFKVTLSAPSAKPVSFRFATANGTASDQSDYQAVSGVGGFNPGQTAFNIIVPVNADIINEPNETFFVRLTQVSNATAVKSSGTGTIMNDDPVPTLHSLTISPSSVAGGQAAVGVITLNGPAPSAGAVITLSDNIAATSVPTSVKIPAGETSKMFSITSSNVTAAQNGTVTAKYGALTRTAALTVRPVGVLSVTVSPSPVVGGGSVNVTVILERAAPGNVVVNLSDTVAAADVPASVTIPLGRVNKVFTVPTAAVSADQTGTLTATANGVSRSTSFTVKAPTTFCPAISFLPQKNVSAGTMPTQMAVADFNGDGKQDIAVTNSLLYWGTNSISVLPGNGLGGFGTRKTIKVENFPQDIAAGDFNGDGKADLAVTIYDSTKVSVLLGDGAGGFGQPLKFEAGPDASSILAADFNGDGRLDLAVAHMYTDYQTGFAYISILYGDGAGGFPGYLRVPFVDYTFSLVSGDFNLDGRPDLAGASVSVVLNNGATFRSPTHLSPLSLVYGLDVGDVNNDGKPDLVVPDSQYGHVQLFLGNGAGGFGAPSNISVGGGFIDIAVQDINRDGKPDLAAVDSNNQLVVLTGNGDGTFAGSPLRLPAGTSPQSVLFADFNNDGRPDMVSSSQSYLIVRMNGCTK
jgi:hypothetical protein